MGCLEERKMKIKKEAWYWLFILPSTFVFITVVIIPFFLGIGYSFYEWDGMPLNEKLSVGIDNYAKLFSDSRFLSSAGHTVFYTVLAVVLINLLGFAFAIIVTSKLKLKNIGRTMLFMPYLIGGLILGYIWKFVFTDIFKALGEATGFTDVFFNWLLNSNFALFAIVIVSTWQLAGYIMIIYITGIQAIPEDVIEAANMDGAGFWRMLFKVKLPLLMPSITVCLFITLSNSFKIFDVNFSLTGGGPNNATEMFAMNIYNEIFSLNHYGYGQAKAMMFFVVVATVTLVQVVMTKRREVSM